MKRKVNCGELSLEKTLLVLPQIVRTTSETWPNPRLKVNSTLAGSFQQEPCREMDVIPTVNYALSRYSKDKLGDLDNYLNQKVIVAINTLVTIFGSPLLTANFQKPFLRLKWSIWSPKRFVYRRKMMKNSIFSWQWS